MNYYYDLKIYSNISHSLVPNILSFKQEIVNFKQKNISSGLLNCPWVTQRQDCTGS